MNRSRSNKGLAERETDKHRAFEVERHSIDFVPLAERYGTPSRLFTIFFSTNFMIVGVAVGTLGITAGLGLWWVMAGLAIGNAIGTVFTAAHSAQGPHLGIPQMIQSRAQFGVLGAGLPLVAVIITYVLYTAANGLLVEGTLNSIAPLGATRALILFGTVTVAVAFMGYELIHRLGATLTVLSGLLFVAAAWLFLTQGTGFVSLGGATAEHFNRTLFLVTITQAAAWCLSYGPIVADYSRYLPPTVKTSTTFWYSGLGIFFGATLVMIAGAYLASRSLEFAKDPGRAVAAAFGGARPIASTIIALGVLETSIMNLYSGYMATMTIFTGLHRMIRIGRAMKLVVLCALMVVSTLVAVLAQTNFEIYFRRYPQRHDLSSRPVERHQPRRLLLDSKGRVRHRGPVPSRWAVWRFSMEYNRGLPLRYRCPGPIHESVVLQGRRRCAPWLGFRVACRTFDTGQPIYARRVRDANTIERACPHPRAAQDEGALNADGRWSLRQRSNNGTTKEVPSEGHEPPPTTSGSMWRQPPS